MTKKVRIGIAAMGLFIGVSQNARAQTLLNGGFETTTNGKGQLSYNTALTGWTVPSGGYAFLFGSGTADTTGAVGQYGTIKLWGPNDGSANGLTASSPNGGNFVALDGAFQEQPIQQTVTGLTVGNKYAVSFYWAGAQQSGFTGATQEQFKVSFGGDTQSTALLDNANHGFTGWQAQTFHVHRPFHQSGAVVSGGRHTERRTPVLPAGRRIRRPGAGTDGSGRAVYRRCRLRRFRPAASAFREIREVRPAFTQASARRCNGPKRFHLASGRCNGNISTEDTFR